MRQTHYNVHILHKATSSSLKVLISVSVCVVNLQEGLILGESKFEEQITISDSQADHIHIEEIYSEFSLVWRSITSSLPQN